ncbi:sphingosine 1-phosphate receptor 3 [Silurus meridionalis]|uniref:G-protein coupled receptors family 1 profile domain-containing protein n=1 Tax=Silurus meridionalis TaxID=175797 RepID=A0A8T0AVF4_SILME|nr:sphingosine 1-phosphate receptor 3 [Silurus meridionalis]KAF7696688.1 hypothetical protein HF521_005106 [Silurus meridionalis]KAI5091497.1 sphingosine 1-phosphate receptor 3 [Silurus meridionalis]
MTNPVIYKHYNYTGKLDNRNTTTGADLGPEKVVFLIICIFIVLENLIVLIVIWKNHKFHSRMYFFIGNLALCDLLAGLMYSVNLLMSGERSLQLSTEEWFIREASMFVALGASIFSLLAIAIERHLTMIKMRPYDTTKNYRVFLLIGMCWLIAVALGLLPILGWNCLGNLPECSVILPLYAKKYVAFCITIFIALLLAILVLYVRIYILVKTSSRKVMKHSSSEHSMALLRTVIIVVGVFITCWMPIFILLLTDVACKPKKCSILFKAHWFIALAVMNSAINPMIYTLASREMRRAFFSVLCGAFVTPCTGKNGEGNRSKSSSQSQKPAEDQGGKDNAVNQPS